MEIISGLININYKLLNSGFVDMITDKAIFSNPFFVYQAAASLPFYQTDPPDIVLSHCSALFG